MSGETLGPEGNGSSASGASGVSQIVAGTGISVSPVGGTGVVTVTNTGAGSGTVTSVSVVSANGLAGTVATATTTPAITLSTTITADVLKANGTAISAASVTGTGGVIVESVSPALTGTPTAPTAAAGTSTTQLATTAFVTTALTSYPTSTITADPNPGVVGTYYRINYAGNGNFTLPVAPATGSWILVKQISAHTTTFVGTIDGNTGFTITSLVSVLLVYNGTTWDAN